MHLHTINIDKLTPKIIYSGSKSIEKSINELTLGSNPIKSKIIKLIRAEDNKSETLNIDEINDKIKYNEIEFREIVKKLDLELVDYKYHISAYRYINYLFDQPPLIIYRDFYDIKFYSFIKEKAIDIKRIVCKIYYTIYFSKLKTKKIGNLLFDDNFYNEYSNVMALVGLLEYHGFECIYIKEEDL